MTKRLTAIWVAVAYAALVNAQGPTVESAWNLIAKGQRGEAIVLLRDIVKADPRNADARLLLHGSEEIDQRPMRYLHALGSAG